MKTIESLSTSELENWIKGTAPSGDIAELERAAIQYACRVELTTRKGGCNREDIPTHEAELALADKESEVEDLESEVDDLRDEVRDAEDEASELETKLEKALAENAELKAKLDGMAR